MLLDRFFRFPGKKAGDDKKMAKHLQQHLQQLGSSPQSGPGTSPNFGSLSDAGTRRVLIDLICTMNASFPDYDFSDITPDHFAKKHGGVNSVVRSVNQYLGDIQEQVGHHKPARPPPA